MKRAHLYERFLKTLQLKKNTNRFVSVSELLKITSPYANRASSYVFSIRKKYPELNILNTKVWSKEADCVIGYYMLVTDNVLANREIAKRRKKLGKSLTISNAKGNVSSGSDK